MGFVSKEELIKRIDMKIPHFVLLGAGASLATCKNGDKNGLILPLMNNLVDVVGLQQILDKYKVNYSDNNFETIYSRLYLEGKNSKILTEIEEKVREYFSSLELFDKPTIYDHLLLSLRDKDVIATFNWDPFLAQAYERNNGKFKLPSIYFLHGSVAVGFCKTHRLKGAIYGRCPECGKVYSPTNLLFPIEKDYTSDPFINGQWSSIRNLLKQSFMFTIFGYSAPKSDVAAISLLKEAWVVNNKSREILETEIIDVKGKNELCQIWKDFLYSHHYIVIEDFYKSWIARHPRRSCEAIAVPTIEGKFIDDNSIPKDYGFDELYKWLEPLKKIEESALK